jgi:hypothetical protein
MWVCDSSLNTISFYDLYQHHIKSTLDNKYDPYPAYFNTDDISYDLIEIEINNLIDAYKNSLQYKPTIPLYKNNKKLSIHIPILLRLNSISHAIKYIPKAYYKFTTEPIYYIQPRKYLPSTINIYIKLFCIVLVFIISYMLHYNNVTYSIWSCIILLCILLFLWKL